MINTIFFSIMSTGILSILLVIYAILSKKLKLEDFSFITGEEFSEKERREKEEELTKKQLKWLLIMFPSTVIILYTLYRIGFPILLIFFGIFYLGYAIAIPFLAFSVKTKKKNQYIFLFPLVFPLLFFLSYTLGAPSFVIFSFFNLMTITYCFTILMTTFKNMKISNRFFLLFFIIIFVYDIIAVGSGILIEMVKGIESGAQRRGMWMLPPIFLILPGSLWLGMGDLFLLGIVFIRIGKTENLIILLILMFPVFLVTFFIVLHYAIPLPASFLGLVSFLGLKLLRKRNKQTT